jgi:hypothetical protein
MRAWLFVLSLLAGPAVAVDLENYWKKPGWDCSIRSTEVLLTQADGKKNADLLACAYSAFCDSAKSMVFATLTCRTSREDACPSVDDCLAMKRKAVDNKDSSFAVGHGRPSKKDGELRAAADHAARVTAQYGTGCQYEPGENTFLAVVYRRATPDDGFDKMDSLCVNRVKCDTPRQRGAEAQVACPPAGTEHVEGIKYHVCPGVRDCLATAVPVRKPRRELTADELPKPPKLRAQRDDR